MRQSSSAAPVSWLHAEMNLNWSLDDIYIYMIYVPYCAMVIFTMVS